MPRVSLILAICYSLAAQSPPPVFDPLNDLTLIEKGLESTTPLQVAISAYRAVNLNNLQRGDWLRKALARSLFLQPESEAVRTRRVILDALIRTRTRVPLSELLPFYDRFPAAVIAITAREGDPTDSEDRVPLLVKAEASKNTAYWYASAALVEKRQLVHHLIREARFDYAISVLDQDFIPVKVYDRIINGSAGGLGSVLSAPPARPPGSAIAWPTEIAYYINRSGDESHVLTCCLGGRTYLTEVLARPDEFENQHSTHPSDWKDHDREVVRVLLTVAHCSLCSFDTPDFPNIRGGKASIVWHSREQARQLLEQAAEGYVEECVRMIAALHEATFSQPEIRAKVHIWIRDLRKVRTEPIPVIGGGVQVKVCGDFQQVSTNGRCMD